MNSRNEVGYSVTKDSNRYTRGGVSDVYNTRTGWWERNTLNHDHSDLYYDIGNDSAYRPDLISYEVYGTVAYTWVVLQFNNIVDINEELGVGAVLKLPTPSRLNTVLLTSSSGGNRVSG